MDAERCVGCHACELACRNANDLLDDVGYMNVTTIGPELAADGSPVLFFLPLNCMHCGKPYCMDVCPTKAITKRADGIVLIDTAKCMGCKFCQWVCPFGAPQFNARHGYMEKCKLCVTRVDEGMQPACVKGCHMKALKFGRLGELSAQVRERVARRIVFNPQMLQSLR